MGERNLAGNGPVGGPAPGADAGERRVNLCPAAGGGVARPAPEVGALGAAEPAATGCSDRGPVLLPVGQDAPVT